MVEIDGSSLTIDEVVRVSRCFESVELSTDAFPAIERSREYVEKVLAEKRVVYGITTGVGELSNTWISYH